jgi:hypothetical protein
MTMMNSLKGFPMNAKQRKKSRDKKKEKFSRRSFTFQETEERLMKKSEADEDYAFLMCLLPSIKKKKDWTTFKDWNSE